jgi:6-phospho-beta-glucosidase
MRDGSGTALPPALEQRGSPLERMGMYGQAGYFTGGIEFMRHVWFNEPARLAPILPLGGSLPGLDPQTCLTASCIVDGSGPQPVYPLEIPLEASALFHSVKAFETLTVRAAIEASQEIALRALSSNPLIASYPISEHALALILERQVQFLPLWR